MNSMMPRAARTAGLLITVGSLLCSTSGTAIAGDEMLIAWAPRSSTQGTSHGSALLRDAIRAREKGKTRLATSFARRALRDREMRTVERVAAAHIICMGDTSLGRAGRALRHCDRAVRSSSEEERWVHHHNRANARLQLGDVEGAVADYEQALALMGADDAARIAAADGERTQRAVVTESLAMARHAGGLDVQHTAATSPALPPAAPSASPRASDAKTAPAAPAPR
jgi:hypothetical protein